MPPRKRARKSTKATKAKAARKSTPRTSDKPRGDETAPVFPTEEDVIAGRHK